jgi:hypothetical protein
MPIPIPSMNDYEITNVQLATNSAYSLGILYGNSTSNIFCIYDISSSNVSFSMEIPQTPNDITFAQEGSEYRLITADASGLTSYCIDGPNAETPLFYPMENITSMGSTITDNGILVYTTVNYGNSTDPLLDMTLTLIPDVTVASGAVDKTIVGLGYPANINVTLTNNGMHPEVSYVTIYANSTVVGQAEVSAVNGNFTIVPLTWNSTNLAYGDYVLSISAGPVLGTIGGTTNYVCDALVHIGVPGDVSSSTPGVHDGITNMRDIAYMITLFNTRPSSPNWNPNADVNNDGVCNMRDIAIAVANFNLHE